ncbi:hypothetical protein C8R45DRAFT_930447 [Mycena sanguinolenta]|nr:hypothetical protein C8R45DRAFT_930447 [Mycena sanguinolenta]
MSDRLLYAGRVVHFPNIHVRESKFPQHKFVGAQIPNTFEVELFSQYIGAQKILLLKWKPMPQYIKGVPGRDFRTGGWVVGSAARPKFFFWEPSIFGVENGSSDSIEVPEMLQLPVFTRRKHFNGTMNDRAFAGVQRIPSLIPQLPETLPGVEMMIVIQNG